MLEWLKTILGDSYTEDIDKKVSTEIGKAFVSKQDFNTLNETKKGLDTQVADRDKQLEELKKLNPEELKSQIAKLQDENTAAKKKFDDDLKATTLNFKIESRLAQENAIDITAVKSLLDLSKISLDGDKLLGMDDQVKTLKETKKWAFVTQQKKTGEHHGNEDKGDKTTAKDEIRSRLFPDTK